MNEKELALLLAALIHCVRPTCVVHTPDAVATSLANAHREAGGIVAWLKDNGMKIEGA